MAEARNLYKSLANKLMQGDSPRIARIWEMLCDETDARLLLAMPGTFADLSRKTGLDAAETERRVGELFQKGVAFEGRGDKWKMAKNIGQFHDATILWFGATREFHDLWQEYMDEEYPKLVDVLAKMPIKPMMRIIPVDKSIEQAQHVLLYEDVSQMVREATLIAVTPCTCRVTAKRCDAPLEVCMQFGRAAEYALKRNTGREVSKEEAIKILRECRDAGLIHLADNKAGLGHVVCNCCKCCCMVIPYLSKKEYRNYVAPSRYRVTLDVDACDGCGNCVERCAVEIFEMTGEGSVQRSGVTDIEGCIGCGVCVTHCSSGALTLEEIRPPEHIPA